MKSARARFALIALGLPAIAGCSIETFSYVTDRYGSAGGPNVTLNCRDVYEVADRPDAGTMLVLTNVLNEALVACFGPGKPLAMRQREAAQIFLAEKTNRPQCRIVAERDLTAAGREFTYRCF